MTDLSTHLLFDDAINTEYMPSQRVPNARDIFGAWGERSASVRAQFTPLELAYGTGTHEKMDIFEPPQVTGTVLWIHGGYWQAFYKDSFSYMAPPLLDAGYRLAVMSYDLVPSVTLRQIVRQARQAASFVGQHYGPLSVAGHSAGAHLAAMIHCADWEAEALPAPEIVGGIGISGLYDLLPLRHTELQPELNLSDAEARALSPVQYRPSTAAPFTVAVGEQESESFGWQSRQLSAAWPDVASPTLMLAGRHHFDAPDELVHMCLPFLR